MSAAVALQSPDFSRNSSHGIRVHHTISSSWAMVSSKSTPATKEKELSGDLRKLSTPETDKFSPLNIKLDRLQRADQGDGLEYGQFVAREAQIDEEYWAAAWLRADAHWENQENDRYAESYKKQFAEQEFNSLKTRCKAQLEEKCNCIVMANKEDRTVKHNVLKSVVGTVDLSYGYLSHGQSFPGVLLYSNTENHPVNMVISQTYVLQSQHVVRVLQETCCNLPFPLQKSMVSTRNLNRFMVKYT
ncbi:GCN5-related N-acetyltransferase 6, chloroplastic isoform X3 [Primulina tabacum]|uniref:GCN5-related N-acetyltransferase 6, chloroplastic isoform X3 n=1 Tax=Primulina tabacum TaxID=48773 RepID=UPI003F5AB488